MDHSIAELYVPLLMTLYVIHFLDAKPLNLKLFLLVLQVSFRAAKFLVRSKLYQ